MRCPYCGSDRIDVGVAWGKNAETGAVGLVCSVGKVLKLTGVIQVYSDLCLNCGTLLRSYIKEDPNRNWIHRSGNLGGK